MPTRQMGGVLRFTVTADTVDGIHAAADDYLRKVGGDPYDVSYEMTADTIESVDGAGRHIATDHLPIRADVTAWLKERATT